LLPDTDADGALRAAGKVHERVGTLAVASAGIGAGAVTVSIGVAVTDAAEAGAMDDLYRRADRALYEAKSGGRNQTRRAPDTAEGAEAGVRPLRLVKA
jgi:diguanylate cyclase (GGDEF)-like protein